MRALSTRPTLVVPCYNEEQRLDPKGLEELLARPGLRLVLVDDGSTDGTLDILEGFAACRGMMVDVLRMPRNVGKGEAIRAGLLLALEREGDPVGYLDADFATPPAEVVRLLAEMSRSEALAAWGCRVARLGARIERRWGRHYLGRAYATVAALVLDVPVYDTQCGAKVFRDTAALRRALSAPFSSRWSFDVELIGRLRAGEHGLQADRMLEMPLREWTDVQGSKLVPTAALRAGLDLLRLSLRVRQKGPAGFFPPRR